MASTQTDPVPAEHSSGPVQSYPDPSNALNLTDNRPDIPSSSPRPTPLASSASNAPSLDGAPSPTHSNTDGVSSSNPPHSRPVLVQLGSSITAASAPHPKRFSTVNINKKFLEKNSTAPTAALSSSVSNSSKPGIPNARQTAQSTSSHPRLITTKLTAAPQPSSTPGPGWSRPSSVTPPVSTPNLNGTPAPAQATANVSIPVAPQLPHIGKVIQPQPRSAAQISGLKDGVGSSGGVPTKPVWGNVKGAPRSDLSVQNDFPTAAEVAHARKPKVPDPKEVEIAEATKQARMEEADTFRGVHLDPNAHHWDEMEEDDDNFLDGVIEFGDGRQYKIDTTQPPASPPIDQTSPTSYHEVKPGEINADNDPVTKEERFVDDFDRSWPRTKPPSSSISKDLNDSSGVATSPNSVSPPQPSPQESSRVLFNERSNRLEPYSNARSNQGPYQINKRNHHSEFQDSRGKPSGDSSRGGRFGLDRPREGSRRESFTSHPSSSPRSGHDTLPLDRGRRLSNMGPPPVPAHARTSGFKDSRQLPPHLSQHPPSRPFERRPSESHPQPPDAPRTSSRSSSRQPSESSTFLRTPGTAALTLSPEIQMKDLSSAELDDVRKDLMQSAAARAKARRQQEEEEREKERERARHKALLLEQKMAPKVEKKVDEGGKTEVSNGPSDDKATAFINDAIASAEQPKTTVALRSPSRVSFHETPRVPFSRRLSSSSSHAPTATTSIGPSTTTESWRVKSTPARPNPPPSFVAPPLSALDQVQSIAEDPDTVLEVVDYSDLAKFVGVTETPSKPVTEPPPSQSAPVSNIRSRRPLASDFFEKEPNATETKADASVWRRNSTKPDLVSDQPSTLAHSRDDVAVSSKEPVSRYPDQTDPSETPASYPTSHFSPQRNGRNTNFYKEATISALDDAMSRIKGALDGMQATDRELHSSTDADHLPKRLAPTVTAKSNKWVPPALRSRPTGPVEPQEEFLATSVEPPRSPKPAWSTFVVRMPKVSTSLPPISRKQKIAYEKHYPLRWDILSFTPSVEGMTRRDLSLNDVLFRRPYVFKGKMKYKVSLPKNRIIPTTSKVNNVPSQSILSLPKSTGSGAFGKPPAADGASSWRKSVPSTTKVNAVDTGLNTTSRSPPPEPEATIAIANIKPSKMEENTVIIMRARSQPKMPEGSGVAYYRDSRVVAAVPERKPSVSFFAASESEVTKVASESTIKPEVPVASIPVSLPSQPVPNLVQPSLDTASSKSSASTGSFGLPSLVQSSKTESKSSGDSPDRVPITPPSHHSATPWSRSSISMSIKDSSMRGPDPEHLKAVWSQTSNQAGLHPVNSLEGIADDLTPVPFIIQDVKSEDGGTPPPTTSVAPSRMSLHDVTRAFQQVPSSSNISSHRPTISPPSTTAPVARPSQQNFGYSMPTQPTSQNVRSNYHYPSPMLSHSPAPMYSHPMNASPIPSRMQVNGSQTPLYSGPVWMPLPSAPTQNSGPGNMMRPMASYPPPLMHYPSPAPQPMYGMPTNMQTAPSSQNNTPRGRNMPSMMSPVMSHAHPVPPPMSMYTGSPVMMPAHAGRGQVRNDGHSNLSQHQPPPQPQPYTTLPGTSFPGVRPTW